MIIWISSYPKSGNTLLRSILSAYFYSEEGSFEFNNLYKISQFPAVHHFMRLGVNIDDDSEVFKNFINAQNLINQESKKAKFFKTHSRLCQMYGANFTDLKNTLGVIYVIRDPRNVVTSFAHHYNLSIEEATDALIDEKRSYNATNLGSNPSGGGWIYPGKNDVEYDATNYTTDFLSNGFKIRHNGYYQNDEGTFVYLAIGQTMIGSNNVPGTAY